MKTQLKLLAIAPALFLSACAPFQANHVRIGDTPARRIAKDPTLPGKGVQGECLPYAVALHRKLEQAGIPSRVVTFGYTTGRPQNVPATRHGLTPAVAAHAAVVYDDGGRTYMTDNQSWLPTWIGNGSLTAMAQTYAGPGVYVTDAAVLGR